MKLLTVIALLSLLLQTSGLSPVYAQPTSTPIPNLRPTPLQSTVVLERTWDYVEGSKTYRVTTQSLGTFITADEVLTHNHFAQAPQNATRQLMRFLARQHTLELPQATVQRRPADAGTLYLSLPQPMAAAPAQVASQATVEKLGLGDWLTVVFWENGQPTQAQFMVLWVKEGVATVADPAKHINPGDSGGGAFYNGQLVGNTWAIYQWEQGGALGAFKVALLPMGN
jgi:hypothetical protein